MPRGTQSPHCARREIVSLACLLFFNSSPSLCPRPASTRLHNPVVPLSNILWWWKTKEEEEEEGKRWWWWWRGVVFQKDTLVSSDCNVPQRQWGVDRFNAQVQEHLNTGWPPRKR